MAHPLSTLFTLSFALGHLLSTWKSANITALHKKGQKLNLLTLAYFQSSARSWNPSSQLTWNHTFFPTTSSQINHLDSQQVTLPWTCCFYSPKNGWRPSMSDVRWADCLDTSSTFDTLWHPALLSKLSAKDIQGQLHTWITDFLSSRSQHMALTRIPSSPLPVKAGAPK